MTRNGKIARLPRELRDELNRRLDNGEPGVRLAKWLNALPEAQEILKEHFGERPISEQNLSEWKSGGYRDWLARQEALSQARELAADAKELVEATSGRLTDHLATVLAARYAGALASWNGEATEEFGRKLRTLRILCEDIVELRRGDHSSARLDIERLRFDHEREKTEEEVVEHFKRWIERPEVRASLCQPLMSTEEREQRIRQIFGLAPNSVDELGEDGKMARCQDADQTKSNQIKAN